MVLKISDNTNTPARVHYTKLVVGPLRNEMIVSTEVLTKSSKYFQAAYEDAMARNPGADMIFLSLPDVDYSMFSKYIEWLCRDLNARDQRIINVDFPDIAIGVIGLDVEPDHGTSIMAFYLMGLFQLEDDSFCEAIVGEDVNNYLDGIILVSTETVAKLVLYTYYYLPETCHMYRRLVHSRQLLESLQWDLEWSLRDR